MTPTYLALAERAAKSAEAGGASVARAYSPVASPERVLEAVADADIIVYFGHGNGYPNPYGGSLNPDKVNGWGLQGPRARGTHADSWADGSLAYYGEAWIEKHARPAPGFVMIYSNVCYAPGASEPGQPASTPDEARARAGGYARAPLSMGASAVFATDYYGGAAELVGELLSNPTVSFGDIVRSGSNYVPEAMSIEPHPYIGGADLWLQRSPYFSGLSDSWFAFSGNPTASFASAGAAQSDALLAAFEKPMTLRVQPGNHLILQLDANGQVVGDDRWRTTAPTDLAVTERRRIEGQDGAWYRISDGAYAGGWIPEGPDAHLPGLTLESALSPARVVELASGTHAGHRFTAEGTIAGSKVAALSEAGRATADELAVIDGQLHVRLADGTWAGFWLLVSDAVRVGGPVPLSVDATPHVLEQTPLPMPTAEPTPIPPLVESSVPAATPPASPVLTPTASPSLEPTPSTPNTSSPVPTPSPQPSASPHATESPAQEASASPSTTPVPSPTESPVAGTSTSPP